MVGSNARYARYVAIAVFTLAIFYFMTSPDHETIPLQRPPSHPASRPPGSEVPPSHSPADEISPPHRKESDDQVTLQKPSHDDEKDFPLAMSPMDPNWDDDIVGLARGPRMNATFVTLARNSDVWEIARSIRQVEDRFNRRYNYDWVFLNDQPFDDTFKEVTTSLVSGKTHYGQIPQEHWSFPEWIDQERAKKTREDMSARKIIYGDSVSYRHMCRFESGFFFRQPLMMNYDYYWRVEPSIELYCDIHYDPFRVLHENGKKYSFVLSLYEYVETIKTLWDSTKKFMKNHPEYIAADNSMKFLSDDGGETYNRCHFWSNFEVGSLNWLRSKPYIDYFESLDKDGGFFYERWGDAPVHSIAAGLLLNKSEIHFFNDIAYYHVPFTHCPTGEKHRRDLRCHCNPKENFDWKGYSCTSRYFEVNDMEKPDGYKDQTK
ncbi:putative mannosyltransferase involved in N-linked and O-linked glycosylation [Drechmeria coniospora]|uniref:Putative mannosyltransferase involved in N-linked and O-linked glycosylation n=1 Tax=Drechmeria coniospora TaxID=98403 RepID=A0A151GPT7_DRECN|nr:putative mannosyltransferase involved in N-linked and O-linked glycosylation [Drechmeria coniospora]KYK59135.1 putative mannosyltransferase involved in N-linked and O-linked glycosylation [Drechmeria coniospora]